MPFVAPRLALLALAAALVLPAASQEDRLVARRPLGQEASVRVVLPDVERHLDSADPSRTGVELRADVWLTMESSQTGGVAVVPSVHAPTLGRPAPGTHAVVDRYAGRMGFSGSLEVDTDGDGTADGLLDVAYPVTVTLRAPDGAAVGEPVEVLLRPGVELADEEHSVLSADGNSLAGFRFGLLVSGDRARLVGLGDGDGTKGFSDVEYVEFAFGAPPLGAPAPLPPVMIAPRTKTTLKVELPQAEADAFVDQLGVSQGEANVTWSLADDLGEFASGSGVVAVDVEDVVLDRLTLLLPQGRPARARVKVGAGDPTDLGGGGHLLLSTTAGPDGCPPGTVSLDGRCYINPGDTAEPQGANKQCPAGYHLCSCGQCVRNPPPPSYQVDSFFDISYRLDSPPTPPSFPTLAVVDVFDSAGLLLRSGTALLEGPGDAAIAYDSVELAEPDVLRAVETEDGQVRWRVIQGGSNGADFAEVLGGADVTLLSAVDPSLPSIALEPRRELWKGSLGGRLPANPADIGGTWTWEVETLDADGAVPAFTASGAFEADFGEILIDGVVFECEW